MDIYVEEINRVHTVNSVCESRLTVRSPKEGNTRSTGAIGNRSARRRLRLSHGGRIHRAGMDFLGRIHLEVADKKRALIRASDKMDRIGKKDDDLNKTPANATVAPKPRIALGEGDTSDEYLRSLNIDPDNMGSNRVQNAELLGKFAKMAADKTDL